MTEKIYDVFPNLKRHDGHFLMKETIQFDIEVSVVL